MSEIKDPASLMDTDDDVSTIDEEEASLLQSDSQPLNIGVVIDEIDAPTLQTNTIRDRLSFVRQSIAEEEIKFSVVCAHTQMSETGKYVVYSIMVECEVAERPALLERRYSDFFNLWSLLQESHPGLINQISFPKKAIVGNFKTKLIEERSHSFEELLSYIYSKDVLRCSEPFVSFLYRRELQESGHFLLHSKYEDAIPILENIYCLLCRLKGDKNLLLRVLLQLIVCLHAITNYELAYDYALVAFPRFDSRLIEGNFLAKQMYLPFLIFCVRLWWMLGKDRKQLDEKLQKENQRVEAVPELLDILRDEISLPSLYA